jgi:hypothetical protein
MPEFPQAPRGLNPLASFTRRLQSAVTTSGGLRSDQVTTCAGPARYARGGRRCPWWSVGAVVAVTVAVSNTQRTFGTVAV